MRPSRREFLIASTLVSAAPPAAASAPALSFPTAPRDRIAIASYSFRAGLRSRNLDIKDFPAMIVKRYNIHNVELLGQHLRSTDATYLAEMRAALKAADSHVVNIPTGIGASVYDPDPARRAVAIANAKKWIDNATALDCPSVRVHVQKAGDAPADVALAADTLGKIADYGASRNVVVNLENDDLVSEDAFFLVKVLDRVGSPWLRALPDFCNSMLSGNEKFNYDAITALFKRAYNISHLKDSEVDSGKLIRIDLARTLAIATASGYKGYFSVEWEGQGDVYVEVERLINETLQHL